MKKPFKYFSAFEWMLWVASITLITFFFMIFDREDPLTLTASLIGVSSLIFAAKGNPIGPILMVAFSILYGIISYTFCYYGEMITYLGMTLPMSFLATFSWVKNPFKKRKAEVKINRLNKSELYILTFLTALVTVLFYFILRHFNTVNLLPGALSVGTSFLAVYLTYRRSPYYALAYAANDIVLIVLWVLASISDIHYISVAVCFAVFLFNDVYGFISWKKMQKRQSGLHAK